MPRSIWKGAISFGLVHIPVGLVSATSKQGVVAGVGFLCAGTILKGETARGVIGLTTAAGVWLTAAIGIACGLGSAMLALLGTLLGLFILNIVPRLVDRSERNTD